MTSVYKIAVLLHVFAAVIWVGGVLFLAMVALPSARLLEAESRRTLIRRMGIRFRAIGWSCIAVLIVTGTFLMWFGGARPANVLDLSFFGSPHTHVLGIKLILVLLMVGVSGLHDWFIGPKALNISDTQEAERSRRLAARLGQATGVLVVFILICAVFVARPWM